VVNVPNCGGLVEKLKKGVGNGELGVGEKKTAGWITAEPKPIKKALVL
jgi:hypothetical protein